MSAKSLSQSRQQGGYRKGEQTKMRILETALSEFGRNGYANTTTRLIADKAEVNLPALTYYFGSKEGLYIACAQLVIARYSEGAGEVASDAAHASSKPLSRNEASAALAKLMTGLARFLLTSSDAVPRTLFVQREIASPGPAFDILYSMLWEPGVELVAKLLSSALGDKVSKQECRLRAIMLISGLSGLVEGREIIAREMNDEELLNTVISILNSQMNHLASI